MFEGQNQPWNGTLNGKGDAPMSVYYWVIEYEYWSAEGEKLTDQMAGNVTLVR